MALHVLRGLLLPLLHEAALLEEEAYTAAVGGGGGLLASRSPPYACVSSGTPTALAFSRPSPLDLLALFSDASAAHTFVQGSHELLSYLTAAAATAGAAATFAAAPPTHISADGDVWPLTEDPHIHVLMAPIVGTGEGGKGASLTLSASGRCLLEDTVCGKGQAALLLVLLLRASCGLRGVPPSRLFSHEHLQAMRRAASTSIVAAGAGRGGARESEDQQQQRLEEARLAFLEQCLSRLKAEPPAAVYRLAELWDIKQQTVRLLHLPVLVAHGCDEDVAELATQVADSGLVVDRVTHALRIRVGGGLARIDRLPAFGPVVASLDADAVAWARSAALPVEASVVEQVARGQAPALGIDLPATRHLVLLLQGLLLSTPVAARNDAWAARKRKLDALLGLCSTLATIR